MNTLTEKQRTTRQNKALHKYFSLVAEALNDAGLDMRVVLKPHVAIPWTTISVKKFLWKPIQDGLFDKDSTAELTTKEPTLVYETLNRFLSEKFHVHIAFPSYEEQMMRDFKPEELRNTPKTI